MSSRPVGAGGGEGAYPQGEVVEVCADESVPAAFLWLPWICVTVGCCRGGILFVILLTDF